MQELPIPLDQYATREFTFECITHPVYSRGSGPAVIVLHELPGIGQEVVTFAERVVELGFTAVVPSLVGSPRRHIPQSALAVHGIQICLSGEFRKLATGVTSPVVGWLRGLAREFAGDKHEPVGVVGMCLTGGFALAMAVDPWIKASVVAEPSLPFPIGARRKRDLGMFPGDWQAVLDRSELPIFGARFTRDLMAPCARFDRLSRELGSRFIRRDIPSGPDSQHGIPKKAHSVLTSFMLNWPPEHPGRVEVESVIEEVLAYLTERLVPSTAAKA